MAIHGDGGTSASLVAIRSLTAAAIVATAAAAAEIDVIRYLAAVSGTSSAAAELNVVRSGDASADGLGSADASTIFIAFNVW